MFTEEATIETLRRWSHILLWISIVLPALGALAVGARYYVERYEKQLSVRLTTNAIKEARQDASAARVELAELKQKNVPRELSAEQRAAILGVLRRMKGNVQILYPADTEAEVFAKRIGAVIREAGWEATEEGAMSFGPVVGLRLEVDDAGSRVPARRSPPLTRMVVSQPDVFVLDFASWRGRTRCQSLIR